MTVHEPATLLTDYALAALGSALAWRVHARTERSQHAARWLSCALFLTALSAVIGGSYHGFAPEVSPSLGRLWWRVTLVSICLLATAMEASLLAELRPQARRFWLGIIVGKFAVFLLLIWLRPIFLVAIGAYGIAQLAWAVAAVCTRRRWSKSILAGIGLSVVAAVVQNRRWGFSAQFNHNDLYHVIQAFALVAFYRAALRVGKSSSEV